MGASEAEVGSDSSKEPPARTSSSIGAEGIFTTAFAHQQHLASSGRNSGEVYPRYQTTRIKPVIKPTLTDSPLLFRGLQHLLPAPCWVWGQLG